MIYLVHGNDTVSSREFLNKLRLQYPSVDTVDAKTLIKSPEIFLSAQSLFNEARLLIVENYSFKDKTPLETNGVDLAIWADDVVTKPAWVDKEVVFKLPDQALTFKLADAVALGQEREALSLLGRSLAENTPAELLVGTLTRQLKLISLGLAGEWEKVSKSSFVQSKVRQQIGNWDRKKLRVATRLLLKTDWDLKTGSLARQESLTFLVATLCKLPQN